MLGESARRAGSSSCSGNLRWRNKESYQSQHSWYQTGQEMKKNWRKERGEDSCLAQKEEVVHASVMAWRGEREEIANCQMDRNLTKTANTYSSLTLRKYLNAGEGVGLKDCFFSQACVSQTQHLQLIVKALSYMFFGTGPLCRRIQHVFTETE